MKKISIIIPVYNREKEIEKCLESVINQKNIEEIETIIINDGSTDNSENIILNYIQNHQKIDIKYIQKENEGIAKTRNLGIKKANGKYIMFVDSDDYIDKNLTEKLDKYINEDVDLIKFKLQRVDKKGNILEKVDGPVFDKISGEKGFNKLYYTDLLLDSPCVYIIKKEIFEKNNFEFKGTYHEDFGLIPLVIVSSKTMVSTPYYFYQYVQVPDSITRNESYEKTIKKMEDVFYHYDNMIKVINDLKISKTTKENIKIYYTNAIILKLNELEKKERKIFIKEIRKRKMERNIKVRNIKQLIKRIVLCFSINLYLKMR